VTVPGIIEEHEVPLDWGWLELRAVEGVEDATAADAEADDGDEGTRAEPVGELLLRKKPVKQEIPEDRALEWLHSLGTKGTGGLNREAGIAFGDVWDARRGGAAEMAGDDRPRPHARSSCPGTPAKPEEEDEQRDEG
jgi:hypothetical protein